MSQLPEGPGLSEKSVPSQTICHPSWMGNLDGNLAVQQRVFCQKDIRKATCTQEPYQPKSLKLGRGMDPDTCGVFLKIERLRRTVLG